MIGTEDKGITETEHRNLTPTDYSISCPIEDVSTNLPRYSLKKSKTSKKRRGNKAKIMVVLRKSAQLEA